MTETTDVLIVGAGLAGLMCALEATARRVTVIAPTPTRGGASSAWAQGGVAAALAPGDTPQAHAADTIAAGDGLVDEAMALLLAEEGPDAVRRLAALGAPFDRTPDGGFALSLEAAHSAARVARVKGDLAGREIMKAVGAAALSARHVDVRFGLRALDLLTDAAGRACGVLAENEEGALVALPARDVVLASGGVGGLYPVTTNPPNALGDALAMAWRAGAVIADPEFVQFHPTAIDVGKDPAPLASEALRGEGARLVDRAGAPLIAAGDLGPRDQVARAVHRARLEGRGALLDAREAVGEAFPEHFPTVFAACMAAGVDPRREPIPVAPAAHYHMGGVETDARGATSVPGLWAVGEAASTGVHGANRLASNSLLEAVVFARRAAQALNAAPLADDAPSPHAAPDARHARAALSASDDVAELPAPALAELRAAMGRHVGVERDAVGLQAARALIEALIATHGPANPLIAARLIVEAATSRRESRGAHARADFPHKAPAPERTRLSRALSAEASGPGDTRLASP